MFQTILKLQQKPVHVRKQIAVFVAGFIVCIVVLIWLATLDRRILPVSEEANSVAENNLAPLTLLKDQFNHIRALFFFAK